MVYMLDITTTTSSTTTTTVAINPLLGIYWTPFELPAWRTLSIQSICKQNYNQSQAGRPAASTLSMTSASSTCCVRKRAGIRRAIATFGRRQGVAALLGSEDDMGVLALTSDIGKLISEGMKMAAE